MVKIMRTTFSTKFWEKKTFKFSADLNRQKNVALINNIV